MSSGVATGGWFSELAPARRDAAAFPAGGARVARLATAAAVAMMPLLTPSGPNNAAPADIFIALALVAVLVWAWSSRQRLRFPYAFPISLILVGGALGALVGPIPQAGGVALVQDVGLVLWFWAVVAVARAPERLQFLLRTWSYAAIAWALLLLGGLAAGVDALSGRTSAAEARAALTFGNANLAANYFFISIMIMWAVGYPRHRGLRLIGYGLLLAAFASAGSNGGTLSLLVGATVAMVIALYRRAGGVHALAALALVFLTGFLIASQVDLDAVQERARQSQYTFVRGGPGRSASSASDRQFLVRQGLDLYRTGGPFGRGPGSTKALLVNQGAPRAKEAHTDYLAALNERGVLGLLGVVALLGGVALHALFAGTAPIGGRLARALASPNALSGAAAGAIVAMAFTEYLHARHLWALFALVAAAGMIKR